MLWRQKPKPKVIRSEENLIVSKQQLNNLLINDINYAVSDIFNDKSLT